ncbi:MAG: hypothetical protein OEY96_10860, partial [Gammaproteobacteria bacterium]|nr:hypothetical protein [Gammaproteobacteria bacterium]
TDGHLDVVLGSESSISEIATSVEFTEAYLEAKEAWFRSLADEELRLLWNARHYIERKEAELSRLRTVIRDRLGISRKLYGSDKNNL